ncbi:solute carrier family 41 member 1 isoform X2 [Ixodes scapularis]|uniref:solute carrier family 41 member 1 isoform X2 n=1 Tax=Ixodes scapularis TaxID=6945 RepID=UPI001A9F4915|nr:solute carrier family 41 member 1 isoform X2 [Ixodes scapularis]
MAAGHKSGASREIAQPQDPHALTRANPDALTLPLGPLQPSLQGGGRSNEGFSRTPSEALFAATPEGSIYSESAALLNGVLPRLTTLEGKPGPELLLEENELQAVLGAGDHPLAPTAAVYMETTEGPVEVMEEEETVITKERLRVVAVQVFIPFLTAGFGTVGAGLVLDVVQRWPAFVHISELFILVPALLGLKGNLEMTLAARLSTQANLGNMDTGAEQLAMTTGNMALIQCQATVVAFLASLFAVLMGYVTESRFDTGNAVLLCASSMVTASVASLLLGSLMVGVVIFSRKCHLNPDNIATPIAASLGDLTTLALLAGVSSLLFNTMDLVWLSPLVVCVFLAFIPLWVYLSRRNPYTKDVLCTGWVPVICAMGISSVGGCILDAAVTRFSGLAVFQPVINGVGGNLVAIQSCKLSTFLAQRSKMGSHPSSDNQSCINPCSAFCGKTSHSRTARLLMLMVLPGHVIFVYTIRLLSAGHTVITPIFLACYLTASLFQVALLLYFARCMVYWMWGRRIDPDNAAIPYLTALGDLLGIALLALSFWFLDSLGDASVTASGSPPMHGEPLSSAAPSAGYSYLSTAVVPTPLPLD